MGGRMLPKRGAVGSTAAQHMLRTASLFAAIATRTTVAVEKAQDGAVGGVFQPARQRHVCCDWQVGDDGTCLLLDSGSVW